MKDLKTSMNDNYFQRSISWFISSLYLNRDYNNKAYPTLEINEVYFSTLYICLTSISYKPTLILQSTDTKINWVYYTLIIRFIYIYIAALINNTISKISSLFIKNLILIIYTKIKILFYSLYYIYNKTNILKCYYYYLSFSNSLSLSLKCYTQQTGP
jgi:hypothetical protein